MKIALVRVDDRPLEGRSATAIRRAEQSAKASSSSKNVILALQKSGFVTEYDEWRFWKQPRRNPANDCFRSRLLM